MKSKNGKKTEALAPPVAAAAPTTELMPRSDAHLALPRHTAPREVVPGFENMGPEDIAKPRLSLCQDGTPQRKKGNNYIPGLTEGQWFNSVTGENYGDEVTIVPLLFFKNRIFFNPLDEGGGVRCQASDNEHGVGDPGGNCFTCPFGLWGKDGEAPECSQFFSYPALVMPKEKGAELGPESLVILGLKSTALKSAKSWNAKMRHLLNPKTRARLPMFAGAYKLSSADQKNQAGQQWKVPVISNVVQIENIENLQVAREAYESVRELFVRGQLKMDVSGLAAERPDDARAETGEM